jgi:hypothetical protein
MPLTDQELRDVLARAEEIQRGLRSGTTRTELEHVISAGEEVGLSRAAMERALRERLGIPLTPPSVGSLVFARSANDKYYVAEVLSVTPDAVRVKFLRGSEHTVEAEEVQPCAFIPGEKVMCEWPWWGPWPCTIIGYDAARQRVKVSDGWGYTRSFPVAEIWMPPTRKEEETIRSQRRIYSRIAGVAVVIGMVVGSVLTLLFG